jgi:hypothetical protein
MAFYTRQITFKVSQAIATRLDKLGAGRDLSRNLVAKQLVIAALNGEGSAERSRSENALDGTAPLSLTTATDAVLSDVRLMPSAYHAADEAVASLLSELRQLRSSDVAALRNDIRRLGMAFFCQAGLDFERAREQTGILFDGDQE